jgi:hypothetical protein
LKTDSTNQTLSLSSETSNYYTELELDLPNNDLMTTPLSAEQNNKTLDLFDEYQLDQDLISMPNQTDMDEELYTTVLNVTTSSPDKMPQKGSFIPAPDCLDAENALNDLNYILQPIQATGKGHKDFSGDQYTLCQLTLMQVFLHQYTAELSPKGLPIGWQDASFSTAAMLQRGQHTAEKLCKWTHDYIENCNNIQ